MQKYTRNMQYQICKKYTQICNEKYAIYVQNKQYTLKMHFKCRYMSYMLEYACG